MGTLVAFSAVCIGVLILRRTAPDIPRSFRVPFAPVTCALGVLSCIFLLWSMGIRNWVLMGVWTVLGVVVYFTYSYRHSRLRRPS
jgi:APA family basic amino acid/polyamine antiporter